MTLSIEDLRVDSYATQLSELELTELKGGVTPVGLAAWLTYVGVAATVTAVGTAVVAIVNADNDHKECDTLVVTTSTKLEDGTVVTSTSTQHVCRE